MGIDRRWITPSASLIAFVLGLEIGSIFIQKGEMKMGIGDAATWAGAIGTFAALMVTAWVATGQTRQKNLEAHNQAVLCSAKLLPKLRRCQSTLQEAVASLKRDVKIGHLSNCKTRSGVIQRVCDWKVDELHPLAVLPCDTAYRLASLGAELFALTDELNQSMTNIQQVSEVLGSFGQIVYGLSEGIVLIDQYCKDVSLVSDSLRVAINECEKILPAIAQPTQSE